MIQKSNKLHTYFTS